MNEHENANEKWWITFYEVLKKQKYFDDPGNSDISEYIDMLTHSVQGYSVDEEGKYTKGIDLPAFCEQLSSEENLKLVRKERSRAKFCDELKKVFFDLRDVRNFERELGVDYLYQADKAFWTATEAACFLSGIDQETHGYLEYNEELTLSQYKTLLIRARDVGAIKTLTEDGGLDPKSVIEWTEKNSIEIPYKLRIAMGLKSASWGSRTDHVNKKLEVDEPLTGLERQELGRLQQEKDKWETSIKAAVHAALFGKKGEIKRNDLIDELGKFHIPDTTIETIWKALRDAGLTKGAGRPKKTE
jgi:hypothetical protein